MNGQLLAMQYETEPVMLQIDRAYKADLTFKTLLIVSYDLILGSPWLTDNKAVTDHGTKTVTLPHSGKTVVLHPQNPVRPFTEQDLALRALRLDYSPDGSPLYADEGTAVFWSVQPTRRPCVNPSDCPAKQWPIKLKTLKYLACGGANASARPEKPAQQRAPNVSAFSTPTCKMMDAKPFSHSVNKQKG
eukprot:3161486-Rhodomonas_salina.1